MESAVVGPQKRRGRKRKRLDVQNVTEDCNSKKKVLETRSLKLVGRFVRKEFQNSGVFLGKIVSYDSGLYRINYEDGDCEDLDSGEVKAFLVDCCDLIGMWSERKEKLDDLLSKNVNSKILEIEKPAEPVDANQVDLSLLSGLDNGEAGAKEVEEVLALVDTEADSSSDSCEDARERDSNIDMEVPLVPPPELPLSSGHIGVPEEYVSHLLSVYSLLRSFSVPLFLYPFGLDEFVGALNSPVANTLLDAVHVALMHVVKRHLERLSSDGSELALKCLRCLDWSLLDALTWPVYLVHYLLVMGHINGPDWKGFYTHSLERDYYTLLAGKKLMVLQILCDDVLDSEELRAEMDVREESEVGIDLDASTVFASTSGPRRVHPRYSKTSACKDREAIHGIAEHHEKSSAGHPEGSPVGAPLGSSAGEDRNGDECRLCGMDGFLLCCDGCPSSYHSRCLGLNKMYMPEGSWYCPECKINSSEPEILRGTQLRGGDICGVDPYEQAFVATCGHLLVIKASVNSRICLRYYNRHDIPRVLHALYSKAEHATMYSEICREIMQHWELPENILPLNEISETGLSLANRNECGECNTQLVDLSGKVVPEMTEVDNTGSCVTGINSAEATSCHTNCCQEPLLSGNFSYAMIKNDQLGTILTGQPADSCEFSQQSTSSVAETVSYVRNNNCPVNGDSLTYKVPLPYLELNNSVDRKYRGRSFDNCSYMGTLFKSTDYINYYLHGDFAASAAANLAILSSEENQVPESCSSYNRRKIMSASVSLQLNAFSSAATRFFWPNTEKKLVEVPRERCSWCFSCKAPVSSRRGCLLNAAASNAIKGAMKLVSSVRPVKNGDGRLSGIATYILFMEESLSGLIVGPFLNDSFRKRWRKQVERASTGNAIKLLLLELEENIRSIALSEDWMKLVDGFTSQPPPASQKVASAAGPIQKRKPGRRGRKASTTVQVAIDDCQDTLTDFTWWRGGIQSKLIFPGGFLPGSLIKKAARQGGSKKIPGIHYVEGQETPKTTRQLLWRSAVEMSRSTAQLAHRVRCLDFHVRWADLVRPEQIVSDGKGPETEASAFRNAFISDKKSVEGEIRYCVAFGNQKHLPSRVMKNITEIEQVLDDSKELYWFSETHIPLYLIKEYEEKVEKDRPVDVLSKLQRRQLKTSHKNIFSYLSRKLDSMERNYCCSCHQVVLYRSAVKCSACQGPKWGVYYVGPIQFLVCYGSVVGLTLLGGQCMKAIYLLSSPDGNMKLYQFIIIFGGLMLVLAQIPSFHSLRHINLVSLVLCLVYSTCATAASIYIGSSSKGPEKDYSLNSDNETRIFGIFNALAIIATTFGNGIIPEIQATLAPPVKGKMFKGLCVCYAVITTTFFSVAISGYWAFGNHANGLILNNFLDDGNPLVPKRFILMTNIFTILQLSAVAVVYLQPTNEVLERTFANPKSKEFSMRNVVPRVISRSISVIIATTIAAMLPFFGDINALIGAFGFMPLDFVLPFVFFNLTFKPSKRAPIFWVNITIAVVFSVLGLIATVAAVRQIVLDAKTYRLFANV